MDQNVEGPAGFRYEISDLLLWIYADSTEKCSSNDIIESKISCKVLVEMRLIFVH